MILYLPLINDDFPANVKFFYGILLPLSSMDIIPPEISTELIFNISSDQDFAYNDILEEMGYDTHNSLLNLGSLFLYMCLFSSGLAIMAVLKILKTICPCIFTIRQLYRKLKKKIFWNGPLITFVTGFLEIILSCYLNLKSTVFITNDDYFSFYISFVLLFIELCIIPAAFIYMLTRPRHVLF